ncbi:Replication protein RepA [Burkholderia sp. 8Y]|uniref:replication protein O n=1 Tax=Burkholderia sp. 8Y TaxID=2653133 RepID=UPI0012F288CA|nr:replication protein O [Burkholderia sp. 8Y]VXA97333.1 Replication protein RepA [Burkholderia sp. 8Y]
MHIAQHSVAGEGVPRSLNADSLASPGDQQAFDEFACDRSNLPWVIFRAAHRANHISALPARARAVLAALARTVDAARPFAAIFARRELLTGRALQSMRTFYRSLEDLEASGFITRPPQTRYVDAGLFGRAYLHLTAKAATVLGLTESQEDASSTSHRTLQTAACAPTATFSSSPSVSMADGGIYKDLNPINQKRQPGRLPDDLCRLRALGFREFLIFKFMREARQYGKRLSDVVETTWEHLRRATHPISYLRALLQKPVDYAYRVKTLRADAAEREIRQSRDSTHEQTAKELAGKIFVSQDGLTRYSVSDDGSELTAHHKDESRPRVRVGAWTSDFVTAVRESRVVSVADGNPNELAQPAHSDRLTNSNAHAALPSAERLQALKRMLRLKAAGIVPTSMSEETKAALSIANEAQAEAVSGPNECIPSPRADVSIKPAASQQILIYSKVPPLEAIEIRKLRE